MPKPGKKIDLRDVHAIRRELASVYRDARGGIVGTQDASRLGNLLELLRRAVETGELQEQLDEQRRQLAELEGKFNDRKP